MTTLAHPGYDRRADDRRHQRHFVLWDRRSGFDRRTDAQGPLQHALIALRDDGGRMFALLALLNVLNLLDLALTLQWMSMGATEGNPVMAALFSTGLPAAAVFKLGVVAVVSLVLWSLRSHKRVLEAAMACVAIYVMLMAYHGVGAVAFF